MVNNNELAIIDTIEKDILAYPGNNVPLASIIGRGISTKQESFAGRSLLENVELADQAIDNMKELQDVWNHSHSQWVWKHITLSWLSPYSNLKQIAAEMQRKRAALNEVKWKQVKNEIKIQKMEEELVSTNDKWKSIELKVKICELKEQIHETTSVIEGALKDVLALNSIYEQLKKQVEGFSEEELEHFESKSHLKRSLVQCIRDVRERGSITKGEQEYMEQIGANPNKMLQLIRKYIEEESRNEKWDNTGLIIFVESTVNDLIDNKKIDITRMHNMGMNPDPILGISYNKKIAGRLNGIQNSS